MGILRAVIALLGGLGIAVGTHNDQWYYIMSSSLAFLLTCAWSVWQKRRAKRVDHLGSVLSAQRNAPPGAVPVALQPELPLSQKAI